MISLFDAENLTIPEFILSRLNRNNFSVKGSPILQTILIVVGEWMPKNIEKYKKHFFRH